MEIDIVDCGFGNIASVKNWLSKVNIVSHVVKDPRAIRSDTILLPGVGSVKTYMRSLKETGFDQVLKTHVANDKRLIGICLGFQVMSNFSEEDGGVECLGLLNGQVKKLGEDVCHNGWEGLNIRLDQLGDQQFHSAMALTQKKVLNGRVFYNHEYGFVANDRELLSVPISDSFSEFSGMVIAGKIIGMQFHPEKSQQSGLTLLSMIL